MSHILGVHHIQITAPENCEPDARAFYVGLLGLEEIHKPKELRGRGGVWFHTPNHIEIHVSVRPNDTPPGTHRHIALRVDHLDTLLQRLKEAGVKTEQPPEVEGWKRIFIFDPFDNKLELLEIL